MLERRFGISRLIEEEIKGLDMALFETEDITTRLGRLVEDRPEALDD